MKPEDIHTLEDLIDRANLQDVLEAMAQICGEKADHIRASYSDRLLATAWARDGFAIEKFARQRAWQTC